MNCFRRHSINSPRSLHCHDTRWAEGELREAQVRLELTLAACTGVFKSALWVRRLEQLKRR